MPEFGRMEYFLLTISFGQHRQAEVGLTTLGTLLNH